MTDSSFFPTDRNFFPVRLTDFAAMESPYCRLIVGGQSNRLVIELVPDADGEPVPRTKINGGQYTITWDALDQLAEIYGLGEPDVDAGYDLETFIDAIEREADNYAVSAFAHCSSMEIFAISMDYMCPSPRDVVNAIASAIPDDVYVWNEYRGGTEWSILLCEDPCKPITRAQLVTMMYNYHEQFRTCFGVLDTTTGVFFSRGPHTRGSLSAYTINSGWEFVKTIPDTGDIVPLKPAVFGNGSNEKRRISQAYKQSATPNEFLRNVARLAQRYESMRSRDVIEDAYILYLHSLDERL
ncbi:MAG: hypothetical protein Q3979_05500 [Actinomycetaceae bacterium]|nr:hypothetical protein [Actinomycetaceae bacterium]